MKTNENNTVHEYCTESINAQGQPVARAPVRGGCAQAMPSACPVAPRRSVVNVILEVTLVTLVTHAGELLLKQGLACWR